MFCARFVSSALTTGVYAYVYVHKICIGIFNIYMYSNSNPPVLVTVTNGVDWVFAW